ncbi:hypothetical protein NKH86_11875 [Mesorhizobium sp. M0913]|uniref:hypothetical protein n=1 Tax=Mesorhizobium sp. M0913 TaxID=2957026 RepID=UPI00333CB4C9
MNTASSFAWWQFISDVVSTVIGVVIGFGLSILIHRREVRYDELKEQNTDRMRRLACVKHIMASCAANIETLINFKIQMSVPLAEDTEVLRPPVKARDIDAIIASSADLPSIFQGLSRIPKSDLPRQEELLFLIDDIPMLIGLVHQSSASIDNVNSTIDDRNSLIQQHALQNIQGLNGQAILYYYTMILSQSDNIVMLNDIGLFFNQLLAEQIDNYADNEFKGVKLLRFNINEPQKQHMPPNDYVKGYRDQFRDFSQKKKPIEIFTLADAYSQHGKAI